jgi:hypothetical protein
LHQNAAYERDSQNLKNLFSERRFLSSLALCQGLIVLSEQNRRDVVNLLDNAGVRLPVYRLFHPLIPIGSSGPHQGANERSDDLPNVYHIGWHLRSFSAFARLECDKRRKVLLVPKDVLKEWFLREVVNKEMNHAGLLSIENYVGRIFTASNEEYAEIISTGIVFNEYDAPSGSNLISECISAEAMLVINRQPAFEEYLGQSYPLFYESGENATAVIDRLENPEFRTEVRAYLRSRKKRYGIDRFCRELERIGERLYSL